MALPATRNTNYTPGDPVKSVDLNEIQDLLISYVAPRWRWRMPILATDTTGPWHGTATSDASHAESDLVSGAISIVPLDLAVGDTIVDFGANTSPAGTSTVVVELHCNDQSGTDHTLDTFTTAITVGGLITKVGVAGAMVPLVVTNAVSYWLRIVATGFDLVAAGAKSGLV